MNATDNPYLSSLAQTYLEAPNSEERRKHPLLSIPRDLDTAALLEYATDLEDSFWRTFDHASIGICHVSLDGRFLRVNHKFGGLLGYRPEELEGVSIFSITHPDDQDTSFKGAQDLVEGKKAEINIEKRYVCKDGTYLWCNLSTSLIRNKAGESAYFLTFVQDISESKQATFALSNSEDRMNRSQAISHVGNWDLDLVSMTLWASDEAFKIYGIEQIGHNLALDKAQGLVVREERPRMNLALKQFIGGEKPYDEIFHIIREKDGCLRTIRSIAILESDASGRPIKALGVIQDITVQKETEDALIRSREEAVAANAAKSQFLANMSHEMRTPMNGFMGMMQLLEMTSLTEEQRNLLDISLKSSEALLRVINDILDHSKIEAGMLQLEHTPFRLRKMLEETMEVFQLTSVKKGLILTLHVGDDVPDELRGDPFRLKQVLANLIGNAVKYTEKGAIDVSVVRLPLDDPQQVSLQFRVRDTGMGIPADKQDALFIPFSQVDASNTRRYGGTGLGLSIAGSLVRLMSGQIVCDSKEGKGSCFSFTCILDWEPG